MIGVRTPALRAASWIERVLGTPSATMPSDGDGFFERLALAEGEADAVVARVLGEAGDDQVADAGEAGEGFAVAAEGDAEAGHFGERAGDEGGDRVVAETEAVGHAGGDGIDVLDRAAEFDAGDVVAGVDAEMGQGEELLQGRARAASVARRSTAQVARSRAISSAWLGPVRTPIGLSGKTSWRIWLMRSPVSRSMPLAQDSSTVVSGRPRAASLWRLRADGGGGHGEDDERMAERPRGGRSVARTLSGEGDVREVFRDCGGRG